MKCYRCGRRVTRDDSAIRGEYVPSNRWGAKVGYTEFRRVRLCKECIGPMGWRRVEAQRAEITAMGLTWA